MKQPDWPAEHRIAVILVAVLFAVIAAIIVFPPSTWFPAQLLGESLENAGIAGMLAFVFTSVIATAVGLPRQLVAFVAGLAYGVGTGLMLSLASALLGCYLTLRISARYLSGLVARRYPLIVAQLDRFVENDTFVKILILRFQPFGTNLLTNVCVGFTAIPRSQFLLASGVGYIPQMLVFALLGSGVRVGSQTQLVISGILLGLSVVLGAYIYRRHKIRTRGRENVS